MRLLVDGRERNVRCAARLRTSRCDPSRTVRAPTRSRRRCRCCRVARRPRTSPRTPAAARSTSPRSRSASACRSSAVSCHGLHGGFGIDREAGVGHHLLGPAGAHDRPQHRRAQSRTTPSRRAARRRTTPRPRSRAQRRASVGLPGQRRDPAGQHGERGVLLDVGVAERREPPLHGRHLADAVRREEQLGHQLHAPVPLRRVEQVLERRGRGAIGLVPVGRPQVQLGDQLGLDPAELARAGTRGTARGTGTTLVDGRAGSGTVLVASRRRRCSLAPDSSSSASASGRAQLVEHRGAPQESLCVLGQQRQRLAVEVVGDVPIVAGDRRIVAVAVARDHRGEVEADRPPFGPFGDRGGHVGTEVEVGLREDLCGAGRVEGQVVCRELECVTRRSQSWQVRLFGATGGDELRTVRHSGDRGCSTRRGTRATATRAGRRA